jgi:hypothetical protein
VIKICVARYSLSEKELQSHISRAHLASLNKQSGYLCKWNGCNAKSRCAQNLVSEVMLREEIVHRGRKIWDIEGDPRVGTILLGKCRTQELLLP